MKKFLAATAITVLAAAATASSAFASHSWNGYHWARTSNPFTIKIGDNLSSDWKGYLSTASSDWSQSTVMDTTVVAGGAKNKQCQATAGRVEVCNGWYGYNGWLGIASVWLASGTKHITQATTKVNDTYFASATYNNVNEKQHVMCQEVGHDFGLGHQDESGVSLNTCMDYYHNTSNSDTKSTHPNQHDYDQLASDYGSHTDSSTTIGAVAQFPGAAPLLAVPGQRVSESIYVDRLPDGRTLVTFVRWANSLHL